MWVFRCTFSHDNPPLQKRFAQRLAHRDRTQPAWHDCTLLFYVHDGGFLLPLIECQDCKRQISDLAPTCPGCGRPMKENTVGGGGAQPASEIRRTINRCAACNKDVAASAKICPNCGRRLGMLDDITSMFPAPGPNAKTNLNENVEMTYPLLIGIGIVSIVIFVYVFYCA